MIPGCLVCEKIARRELMGKSRDLYYSKVKIAERRKRWEYFREHPEELKKVRFGWYKGGSMWSMGTFVRWDVKVWDSFSTASQPLVAFQSVVVDCQSRLDEVLSV